MKMETSLNLSNLVIDYSRQLDTGSIKGQITLGNDQRLPGGVEPNSLGYGYIGMRPPHIWKRLDTKRIQGYDNLNVPGISVWVEISGVIPEETVKLAEDGRVGLGADRENILPLNRGVEDIKIGRAHV